MTTKRSRAPQPRQKRAGKVPLVSQAEYARHRGVSREAVRKALSVGRIRANAHGLIDPIEADAMWAANSSASATPAAAPPMPAPSQAAPPADGDAEGVQYSMPPGMTLVQSMTEKNYISAQRTKLELEKASGKLVEVALVQDVAFTAAHNARDRILSLPERIGDELAAITDAAELKRRLRAELRLITDELAGDVDVAEREEMQS